MQDAFVVIVYATAGNFPEMRHGVASRALDEKNTWSHPGFIVKDKRAGDVVVVFTTVC
jgi:hypothetical protein